MFIVIDSRYEFRSDFFQIRPLQSHDVPKFSAKIPLLLSIRNGNFNYALILAYLR